MRPIILIIIDGLGINPDTSGNAFSKANTPNLDKTISTYPTTEIGASGLLVGLPEGQMGNSEVGHLNIGAGRIVYQDYTRINKSISSGEFQQNETLLKVMDEVKSKGKALHLMGLLSDGGVHSHMDHLFALIDLAQKRGVDSVFIHAFMDGRDTPPRSGLDYINQLETYLTEKKAGKIASVMGRFFAMDRDNRWERVKEAYQTMVEGGDRKAPTAVEAMERSYNEDKGDEFVPPTLIVHDGEEPPIVKEGDSVICFNFRSDRAREITRAFTEKRFSGFSDIKRVKLTSYLCMTEYDATFNLPIVFPPVTIDETIGHVVSKAGMKQLRIAETEKYAHVTFFFNGGEEREYKGEERILIPSPKDVRTYDEKPAMSADEVTDIVVEKMAEKAFDFIVLNYANCDMVGHTGIFPAAVEAVETVDSCLGRILKTAISSNYRVIITADHGNAEQMFDKKTGQPHTAHTTNPVYFIIADDEMKGCKLRKDGKLADISPTILELFDIEIPEQMDGNSLILP
ncbi:MAG: 2,3-bisphosphoglycerate-independent phosphoglycerate mutase [Proteobacteria bacterium]|nr:2,3-bisphosphoglycerate-independent phosphoglycerate mutase [Pseudomonadota bacterium]